MKREHHVKYGSVFLAVFLMIGCSAHKATESVSAPPPVPQIMALTEDADTLARLEKLSAALEEKRAEMHIPGMSLAVVQDDKLIYARGFGHADMDAKIPATPETLYAIGSATKAFSSAVIASLIAEGKMDWDDPVTKYLPEFKLKLDSKEEGREATIRDLLSHRTGFARMTMLWASGADREMILERAVHAEPYAPYNESFYYNNVMFLAAGVAAGNAAGSDWDTLIEERLFKPLGMKNSFTSFTDVQRNPHLALGYSWQEDEQTTQRLPMRNIDNVGPAGSINANVLDMSQWLRLQIGKGSFDGQSVVNETQLLETWEGQIDVAGTMKYGLGWFVDDWNGAKLLHHGGNIDGFAAMVAFLPDSNTGFVLLTNTTANQLQSLSIPMVFSHLLEDEETEVATAEEGSEEKGMDLSPYVGDYIANFASFKDTTFAVTESNGKLFVNVPGQMNYEIKPPNDEGKWYFALTNQIALSFEGSSDDGYQVMYMHQGGMDFEVLRKGYEPPPEIDIREFRKYVGSYSNDQGKHAKVIIRNNRLAVDVPGQMVFEMHLPDENGRRAFRINKRLGAVFEEDAEGRVLSVSAYKGDKLDGILKRDNEGESYLPSQEEVLALRKPEQRKKVLEGWGNFRLSGTARMPQSGIEGTIQVTYGGFTHVRNTTDFGAFGKMNITIGPEEGLSQYSFRQDDILKGQFLKQAQKDHLGMSTGNWLDFYDSMEVVGRETFKERAAIEVLLRSEEVESTTLLMDAETGDVLKQVLTYQIPEFGMMVATILYEDYRDVDGLRVPFRVVQSNEHDGKTVVQYESLNSGLTLADDFFAIKKK